MLATVAGKANESPPCTGYGLCSHGWDGGMASWWLIRNASWYAFGGETSASNRYAEFEKSGIPSGAKKLC
jgi:hypothetical protein